MYQPKPNEVVFQLIPLGVKYICEHCHVGEMIVDTKQDPTNITGQFETPMIKHICTQCKKELLLPKIYPYIEWIPVDGEGGKQNGI